MLGVVERGRVKVGDTLELVGGPATQSVTVIAIEEKSRSLPQAQAGQEIGLILRGIDKDQVSRGQVLATRSPSKP